MLTGVVLKIIDNKTAIVLIKKVSMDCRYGKYLIRKKKIMCNVDRGINIGDEVSIFHSKSFSKRKKFCIK